MIRDRLVSKNEHFLILFETVIFHNFQVKVKERTMSYFIDTVDGNHHRIEPEQLLAPFDLNTYDYKTPIVYFHDRTYISLNPRNIVSISQIYF